MASTEDADELDFSNLVFHEKIGEGGFGTVYHITFKKPYKGYLEAAAKSIVDIPQQEIDILPNLKHPNIITLIGVCQHGPCTTLLLEYAKLGSLHDHIQIHKKLSHDLVLKWMKHSARAIEYLHSKNVIHRDIKSSNVLLFPNDLLKLCDFGLAKHLDQSHTMSTQKGTYRYMAPEIIKTDDNNKAKYSKCTDIYAYGVLAVEIYTQEEPFAGCTWAYTVYHVGKGLLTPSIPCGCPEWLSNLLETCWRYDPKLRPSIGQVVKVLESANADEDNPTADIQGNIPSVTLTPTKTKPSSTWALDKESSLSNPKLNNLLAHKITDFQNGEVIVADVYNRHLYNLDGDGLYKKQLVFPSDSSNAAKSEEVCDLTISSQGYIIVLDTANFVHVFDNKCSYLTKFSTSDNTKTDAKVELTGVTVTDDSNILVRDRYRELITVHSCPEGTLQKVIKLPTCVKSHKQIASFGQTQVLFYTSLAHSNANCSVIVIDYFTKQEIYRIFPRIADVEYVMPGYMQSTLCGCVYDSDGFLYIALFQRLLQDESIKSSRVHYTGHVHKYDQNGAFLECIIKGIRAPFDMSICNNDNKSIFVANYYTVATYKCM